MQCFYSIFSYTSIIFGKCINQMSNSCILLSPVSYLKIISLNSSSTRWIRRPVRPQIAREYRNKISARSCNLKPHQQKKKKKKLTKKSNEKKRKRTRNGLRPRQRHTHSYYPTAIISFLKQNKCRDMSFGRHKRNRRTEHNWNEDEDRCSITVRVELGRELELGLRLGTRDWDWKREREVVGQHVRRFVTPIMGP